MSAVRYGMVLVCIVMLIGCAGADVVRADFNANITTATAPLAVLFTDTSNFFPTGWAWFFGDETYMQAWTRVNENCNWTRRYNPSSVVLSDGNIVLTGGMEIGGEYLNDTWRSTDYGATWTLANGSSGWEARQSHSSVVLGNGNIALMGGTVGNAIGAMNDTWESSDKGATWWLANASSGWAIRSGHSSVVLPNGNIVLTGGNDIGGNTLNDTWMSEDYGVTWTLMNASSGWSIRAGHSSVAMPDGSIVLMGGIDRTSHWNDVWRSTDNGAHWTLMNASPGWSKRYAQSSVAMPDGSIVLTGGNDGTDTLNDVWRSVDNGATWSRLPDPAWYPFMSHISMVMPNGSIVQVGGSGSNETWMFQPVGSSVQNPTHTYTRPGNYSVALRANTTNTVESVLKVGYITVKSPVSIGVFRNGAWYLDYNGNGWWDGSVTDRKYPAFGTTGDKPVAGNWSGGGNKEIGVFRNGAWYLDYSGNGWWDGSVTDRKYPAFGTAGDIPVAGDWNNDGIPEIGVFRNGAWYLDYSGNGWWDGPVTDRKYPAFGTAGDIPVAGDWNNDGIPEIGVFRNGAWYLDYSGNGWWDGSVTDRLYPAFGTTGDKPVAGNW
jgi:PKD repeat protein